MMNLLISLPGLIKKTISNLTIVATDSQRQMLTFGVVLFINYPLYYIIWLQSSSENYENLPLRLIASTLCIPLIFNKYWPRKTLYWLTIYWYLTACYCLPFFFTYMLLMNHSSTLWLMNLISATFFILLLFDVVISFLLLTLGTALGFLVFYLSGAPFYYNSGPVALGDIIATLMAVIVIGSIFSRNKQVIEEIRKRSIKAEADNRAKTLYIDELRQAKEKAEAANNAKADFIATCNTT